MELNSKKVLEIELTDVPSTNNGTDLHWFPMAFPKFWENYNPRHALRFDTTPIRRSDDFPISAWYSDHGATILTRLCFNQQDLGNYYRHLRLAFMFVRNMYVYIYIYMFIWYNVYLQCLDHKYILVSYMLILFVTTLSSLFAYHYHFSQWCNRANPAEKQHAAKT